MASIARFLDFQRRRWARVRRMDAATLAGKVRARIGDALSYKRNLRLTAFALHRYSVALFDDGEYRERAEAGPLNLADKRARLDAGGPFEPPDVALVNRAATLLLGDARRVLEIGAGTGMFARAAAADPRRHIEASELDDEAREWARAHRSAPNIAYSTRGPADVAAGELDAIVALEVIEHVADYAGLLAACARAAPVAIFSTPNKAGTPFGAVAATPAFEGHVREWTAGELYWVLRAFWDAVELYALPEPERQIERMQADDAYTPELRRCGVLSTEPLLLARCTRPR